MLEQLMEMVRQQGQQSVVDNPDVPNEQNEAVMQEASTTIMGQMQQMMQEGGPGAIKNLFEGVQSNDANHPAVQNMANHFAGNIIDKFGINATSAKSIAASLIPMVLSKVMNRAKDPNDSGFNIGSILGSLMGNGAGSALGGLLGGNHAPAGQAGAAMPASGGMMGQISDIATRFGMDKNGDGKTDLSDLMKMFS